MIIVCLLITWMYGQYVNKNIGPCSLELLHAIPSWGCMMLKKNQTKKFVLLIIISLITAYNFCYCGCHNYSIIQNNVNICDSGTNSIFMDVIFLTTLALSTLLFYIFVSFGYRYIVYRTYYKRLVHLKTRTKEGFDVLWFHPSKLGQF